MAGSWSLEISMTRSNSLQIECPVEIALLCIVIKTYCLALKVKWSREIWGREFIQLSLNKSTSINIFCFAMLFNRLYRPHVIIQDYASDYSTAIQVSSQWINFLIEVFDHNSFISNWANKRVLMFVNVWRSQRLFKSSPKKIRLCCFITYCLRRCQSIINLFIQFGIFSKMCVFCQLIKPLNHRIFITPNLSVDVLSHFLKKWFHKRP